jgi:hypothetical protein
VPGGGWSLRLSVTHGGAMNQEWYYQNGGNRHGPVTAAVLKQLADSGEIRPETPVWRQGMAQWAPAKAVKGLFTGNPPSTPAPAPAPAPSPTPAAAPPQDDDLRADTNDWHVFDIAVESAKRYCPSDLPATISGVAGKTGVYSLYAAAALVLLGGVLLAIRGGNIRPLALGLVLSFLLLVCQYVAQRLLGACDVAIRANKSVLSSLAIPNCAFLLCAGGTLSGTLSLWWAAVETGVTNWFLGGVAVLAVGAFASIVAIQPAGISVHVNPHCRVGEEAVGVLTFLLKLLLRCTPIAFAAAVGFATFDAASVVMDLFRPPENPLQLMARITRAISALFAAASIPLVAYITMLLYYLTLDVISAIVSIPAKLDRLSSDGRLAGDDGES